MSVSQIIEELPKLSPEDLLSVRRELVEISEENESSPPCGAASLEGAQFLDRMDGGNGRG